MTTSLRRYYMGTIANSMTGVSEPHKKPIGNQSESGTDFIKTEDVTQINKKSSWACFVLNFFLFFRKSDEGQTDKSSSKMLASRLNPRG